MESQLAAQLAMVSHEMRTPLAIAASAAETLRLLAEQPEPDVVELRRLAEIVLRHSLLAARLVDRLGLAEEIVQGTVHLHTEQVDLVGFVRGIVDDVVAFLLPGRVVTVSQAGPVTLTADVTALGEILFNLLANAAKYSGTELPIDVSVAYVGGMVQMVVRDQGAGIAPEDADSVFDAYAQADPTSRGAGLGLFVSRGLARAHRGELAVRPGALGGSEFVLDLPMTAA